jgi:hydroxypyruvate isomerase
MNRRMFLRTSVAAGTVAALEGPTAWAETAPASGAGGHRFKLNYAPHFGSFKEHAGPGLTDQLKFAADQGFTAWEDNRMSGRSIGEQEAIAATMSRLGMMMGIFTVTVDFKQPTFVSPDSAATAAILKDIRAGIEIAKRVNTRWMTVMPGCYDLRLAWEYQTANAIDNFRRCVELCEPAGIVMVMEPLNTLTKNPGVFLQRIPQAYEICRAVNSPSCKILFDLYHQQIQEGNLIPNIDAAWSEIAYFQSGDNPGRKEPGTGEINYRNIFRHLHRKGYKGVVGMEHGNSRRGREGELVLIQAYRDADNF